MILPKPTGEFEWTQESWGPALRCTALARVADHCFTNWPFGLSATGATDAGTGYLALARALNVDGATPEQIIHVRQVHGAAVYQAIGPLAIASPPSPPEADIIVSDDPSVVLTVRAADCVPVLLADRATGAVSAIHAGWRGTAAGAVLSAVQALSAAFGSEPANITAAVGPSIGPCCYTVGDELIHQFGAHGDAPHWFHRSGGLQLDLWRATRDQLERAGLASAHIHVSELCTFDHVGVFPSYRRDGHAAGRLVAAIRANVSPKNERDTTL
jgi:YfiH family protein